MSTDTALHDGPAAPEDLSEEALTRLSDEMIALIDDVYDPSLLDPLQYIDTAIGEIVSASTAPDELKQQISAETGIKVQFRETYKESSGLISISGELFPLRSQNFTLREIVTDTYRRALAAETAVSVVWPDDYPEDLITALESANLQARYTAEVERRLKTPNAKRLSKLLLSVEADTHLENFAMRDDAPPVYRETARAYLRGEVKLRLVELRTRSRIYTVGQVAYLPCADEPTHGGLVIFLGDPQGNAVHVLPMKYRNVFIQMPVFRRAILQRLALYDQLSLGDYKLRPIMSYISVPPRARPALSFPPAEDIFETLNTLQIERMVSDMDTLVSTDGERLLDQALDAGVFILKTLALLSTLPLGPAGGMSVRLLASFLLGQSAAVLEAIRGAQADIPEQASAQYEAALYESISGIVVPLGVALAGKTLSAITRTRISTRILKHLRKAQTFHGQVSPPDMIKPHSGDLKRIKGELVDRLRRGPEHAQRLVETDARLLNRHVEGHDLVVYRGKVFRGDMRPPEEIFAKGFELRTPAFEIQKDIHQITGVRGGFGGDPNALGLDGRGISTSAYYYREHTGAFVYGGQKGGHTYLIDARKLDGYHLYQNHHNARHPTQANKIRYKPTEINFGENIPPSSILGAYNSAGVFIPNNPALKHYVRDLTIKIIRETLAGVAVTATTTSVLAAGITAAYAVESIEVPID
ncbi:hypothetical protein N5D61_07695 [Pseudomonas sp. GD03842]|uniref:hypothetical protein n=1 Tax=unclassified Pseudomonas TaxID=196821 RepID=UPI0011BE8C15|nr:MULTISPECIES: hypothetical protein [unclassified Pseudomonas]MDH0746222.1 hypothetical protein [Pseudomonas sp. GD03842]